MAISLLNNKLLLGPIGITSYMDAIAMGMPVVTNVNAAVADEIRENGLVGLYRGTEKEGLSNAMKQSLDNYDYYYQNMLKFRETLKIYSSKIIPYFKQ